MIVNRQLVPKLKRQFKTALFSSGREEPGRELAGELSGPVPEDLVTPEMKEAGHTELSLSGEEVRRYYLNFDLLRPEPELEYLTDKELKDALWRLECEFFAGQHEYRRDPPKLTAKLEEFVASLLKPMEDYDVLIPLRNFRLRGDALELGDCTVRHFSREDLLGWGFEGHEMWQSSVERFADQTAFVVREAGNNMDLIVGRARNRADLRLHTLRIALAERNFTPDEQLRFRLAPHTAVRQAGEPRMRLCVHVSPGPWDFEFAENHDEAFLEFAADVVRKTAALPGEFRGRVERALYWLGRAVLEEELDQRVALLCTAMESLLSAKSEVRKGERIAYRMVLLESLAGHSFVHPSQLLWIYNLRSSVVHGSQVGVATKSEYRTMVRAARRTLKNYVDFVTGRGLRRYSELVKSIETSDDARRMSEWLAAQAGEEARHLKEVLDGEIARRAE